MIEFRDVTKVYGNGTVGLDHVNLTIGDGEFVAVIGLSGAGKSTLLRSVVRRSAVERRRGAKHKTSRYAGGGPVLLIERSTPSIRIVIVQVTILER
ncbi:MAG: ATP-binding cassette domain-containing protein [Galactobacillus timonensis]|nr:ATP-binding cassette domain-containing protein [Galactobacillus timonensis]MDD6599474.1 ATP-binding cassette domain-containing protein [Galactobacillus timonensis]